MGIKGVAQDASEYSADATALTFPLGGIGTGNVSLGARGDLRDWEIFNRPNKGNALPNTFFAIRTQPVGSEEAPILRVLEGRIASPHNKSHGYHPAQNGGLPRFANSTFTGEYPLAKVALSDATLPVSVELEAFTPLIPLNPEDSGVPGAYLAYTVTNVTDSPLDVTVVGSLCNPVGGVQYDSFENIAPSKQGKTLNRIRSEANLRGIHMTVEDLDESALRYGSMALVTDHADVTIKPAWLRSGWYDYLREFWDDLQDGKLTDLGLEGASPDGRPDTASLGLVQQIAPGASYTFRFWITWHFPNRRYTWKTERHIRHELENGILQDWETAAPKIRNHYATRFADAWAVAEYMVGEWQRLEKGTRAFHRAMHGGTLPQMVIDAVSANIVPVRSNTCFWLEDGRFYAWEGCFDDDGSCHGTCTHVWSYAYTVAYLFPSLEREMRRIEYTYELEDGANEGDDIGYMYFRNSRSMGETFVWGWGEQKPEAASDGQMGTVLRTWREYQLSGDKQWLAGLWERVVLTLDFAQKHWDSDGDFVLDGRQHNTYDIEFYGPNPLSGIYYLAGLRAGEEMAKALGDTERAERWRKGFEQGSKRLDEICWNGEFYVQRVEDVNAWRYQHGLGCLSDQLLGQLHAHVLGLGDLLPAEHIRSAIQAVFKHNFRRDFTDHENCQRTYVLNDESGLVMCTWPNGGRPTFPFPYSDEVWTGIEYHVAAELIYTGALEEGLAIVDAVQKRHDGYRRSRWDEVECGHHYARSMASWTLLLALSGQQVDAGTGKVTFAPQYAASRDENRFECFWSNGRGWGIYTSERTADGWNERVEVLN